MPTSALLPHRIPLAALLWLSAPASAQERGPDGHARNPGLTARWRACRALIGPLGVDGNVAYTARYRETVIAPGFQDVGVGHRHPGPEAW